MSAAANFAATPKSPSVLISTANTNRDGTTGVYGTVLTAGAGGSRVDRLNITATGTTTAGMVRLFLGSALIDEIPVQAVTPNATTPAWSTEIVFDSGLILQASAILKASTNNAEAFNVTVISGGDF
jgi:hypothetical protein